MFFISNLKFYIVHRKEYSFNRTEQSISYHIIAEESRTESFSDLNPALILGDVQSQMAGDDEVVLITANVVCSQYEIKYVVCSM